MNLLFDTPMHLYCDYEA